ncbi:hexokinase family protein-like protein [Cucurbitaria berberidis CBS 394.84]|uniref:Phosphotransferase n=1 Tax=Cucurbitaria berberidis CBS 394.84 TaxID=1168544 RepID=A0A9P4GJK1_9PLEO|nr:hexokinase family protein-like protein [Cucurbitaria berberidis CBS 394.84]KAF1846571.1 hexokinase family protein-like protein [Cucurbitaria berberidis CBS 394.84]
MANVYDRHDADAANAIETLTGFINTSTLLDLAHRFSATYSDLARTSTEHFLVTPVTALPTGKEKGKFLSIDVGGTNLRVGFIELAGELEGPASSDHERSSTVGENVFAQIKRSHDRNWPIEDHLKMDQAEDLFSWIGDCIAEVVRDALEEETATEHVVSPLGEEILLGITFSFPMAQTRLSEATLLPMGKGFAITSDLNLGKMLLAGYARHCEVPRANGHSTSDPTDKKNTLALPKIRVAAITNDTVATFASLAYAVKAAPNSRVAMGLIVGTGTNATIPMKVNKLHPAKRRGLPNPDATETVVINTEWTIRGTDKPLIDLNIKTPWDLTLDANSDAPGFQPFEYMTSGRYLGEIVRLVLVDTLSRDPEAVIPPSLQSKNAIPTRFLSEVVARKGGRVVQAELEKTYPTTDSSDSFWTVDRVELIRDIAEAVQQRSSALIAAACVGLLDCVGDVEIEDPSKSRSTSNGTRTSGKRDIEELVIAYAGGTISQYPKWLQTCQKWIDVLVDEGSAANASTRVTLKEALEGGLVGAGVLAGMTDDMA